MVLNNNAMQQVQGFIYQFCIALEQCFLLQSGQKLWIEYFGDVTIFESEQIETKHYKNPLTDSHINFWKTLENWLDKAFDHNPYKSLVLVTTQKIGLKSKFNDWNNSNLIRRMEILNEINLHLEKKYKNKKSNNIMNIQKNIFSNKEDKIKEVVSKIFISSNSLNRQNIWKKIADIHAKSIPESKKTVFLETLLGYIISPEKSIDKWEISYINFSNKVASISELYMSKNQINFPKFKDFELKNFDLNNKIFLKKILDIEYDEKIYESFHHYEYAKHTMMVDFKDIEINIHEYDLFIDNLEEYLRMKYDDAKENISEEVIKDSQKFFRQMMSEYPQPFPPFRIIAIQFRNGIYHLFLDKEQNDFKWKLI